MFFYSNYSFYINLITFLFIFHFNKLVILDVLYIFFIYYMEQESSCLQETEQDFAFSDSVMRYNEVIKQKKFSNNCFNLHSQSRQQNKSTQQLANQCIYDFSRNNDMKTQKSQHVQQYQQFFQDVIEQVQNQFQNILKNKTKLIEYKIYHSKNKRNDFCPHNKPLIFINCIQGEGIITNYRITLGIFILQIKMLNINQNGPKLTLIGEGSYGKILKFRIQQKNIVAKRIYFPFQARINQKAQTNKLWKINSNKIEIQQTLIEYCIYKICSAFNIGPAIQFLIGFDLICFNDSIQFYIEQCIENFCNSQSLPKRLKFCTAMMHKMRLIHKDIKLDNILYSLSSNNLVLTDFGISHIISQQLGYLTQTYKQGTYTYCSPQMRLIQHDKKSQIDLYYNDLWGLKVTLDQFNKLPKKPYNFSNLKFKAGQRCQFYVFAKLISSIYKIDSISIKQSLLYYENQIFLNSLIDRIYILNNEKINIIVSVCKKYGLNIIYEALIKIQKKSDEICKDKLEFLIRVYGLGSLLLKKLQQFPQFQLIVDLKNLIKYQYKIRNKQIQQSKNKYQFWIESSLMWKLQYNIRNLHKNKEFHINNIFNQIKNSIQQLKQHNSVINKYVNSLKNNKILPNQIFDSLDKIQQYILHSIKTKQQFSCIHSQINKKLVLYQKKLKFILYKLQIIQSNSQQEQQQQQLNIFNNNKYQPQLHINLYYMEAQYIKKIKYDDLISSQFQIIQIIVYLSILSQNFKSTLSKILRILSEKFFRFGNYKKTILYAQTALFLLKIQVYDFLQYAVISNMLGVSYFQIANYEKSKQHYLTAYRIGLQSFGENEFLAMVLGNIGLYFYGFGQLTNFICNKNNELDFKEQALIKYEKENILTMTMILSNQEYQNYNENKCRFYIIKGLKYYERALLLTKKYHPYENRQYFSIYVGIANGMKQLKQYDKSLQYYKKAQSIKQKYYTIKYDFQQISHLYFMMSQTYYLKKMFHIALQLNIKSYDILTSYTRTNHNKNILILQLRSKIYYAMQQYCLSLKLLKQSLNACFQSNIMNYTFRILNQMQYYFKNQNRISCCIKYCKLAIKKFFQFQTMITDRINYKSFLLNKLITMGDYNFQSKQFYQAIYYYQKSINIYQQNKKEMIVKFEFNKNFYSKLGYCYKKLVDRLNFNKFQTAKFIQKYFKSLIIQNQNVQQLLLKLFKNFVIFKKKNEAFAIFLFWQRYIQKKKYNLTFRKLIKNNKKINHIYEQCKIEGLNQCEGRIQLISKALKICKIIKKYQYLTKKYPIFFPHKKYQQCSHLFLNSLIISLDQ